MPSEPLIALALSLLISLVPFLPAAEKSAPEEEPAPAVEEQPALSAEQLAALAQTPASWFDEPALLDALSKLPHYDETRAQRYLAYRTGGAWTLEQVLRIVNTDNDLPRFTAAVDADPDDGDLILVNKYSRLASDYVPEDLVTVEPAYSNGGMLKSEVNICMQQFAAELSAKGSDLGTFAKQSGKSVDQMAAEMQPLAKRRIMLRLVLSAIAEAEQLTATEEEVEAQWTPWPSSTASISPG